jgi:hypothetical protein
MYEILLEYLEDLAFILLSVGDDVLHDVVAVLALGKSKGKSHQYLHHLHSYGLVTTALEILLNDSAAKGMEGQLFNLFGWISTCEMRIWESFSVGSRSNISSSF